MNKDSLAVENNKDKEITKILMEIKTSESETRNVEYSILQILQDMKKSTEEDSKIHKEEHAFLKTLIQKEKAKVELRTNILNSLITKSIISIFFITLFGLWIVFKDAVVK